MLCYGRDGDGDRDVLDTWVRVYGQNEENNETYWGSSFELRGISKHIQEGAQLHP